MKRIMRQYAFTVAFILCLACFAGGIITVKEKTQYNMDMSPYSTVSIDKEDYAVIISAGENETVIRHSDIEKLSKKAFYGVFGDILIKLGNILEKNAV